MVWMRQGRKGKPLMKDGVETDLCTRCGGTYRDQKTRERLDRGP